MSRKMAEVLLDLAKEQVPLGIYALEKDGVIEMRCDRLSATQAKRTRQEWRRAGYKVYANI